MKKCSHCGQTVPDESRFCLHCGHEIKNSGCPHCGFEDLPEEALFCPICGKPVEKAPSTKASKPSAVAPTRSQQTASKASKPPVPPVIQNLVKNMVFVEGGTFMMGGDDPEPTKDSSLPVHQVTLSSFYIGKYVVTKEEWEAVMHDNPTNIGSKDPMNYVYGKEKYDKSPNKKNSCSTFIAKLNEMTGLRFRLPTEAEWEYAARGGKQSRGYIYAGSNDVNLVAWTPQNSGGIIHEVGQKRPNELGLYDMSGNVWEWCEDNFALYTSEPQINPIKKGDGFQVKRGGNYEEGPVSLCQNTCRRVWSSYACSNKVGFR